METSQFGLQNMENILLCWIMPEIAIQASRGINSSSDIISEDIINYNNNPQGKGGLRWRNSALTLIG